jgi:hypothetical protein
MGETLRAREQETKRPRRNFFINLLLGYINTEGSIRTSEVACLVEKKSMGSEMSFWPLVTIVVCDLSCQKCS